MTKIAIIGATGQAGSLMLEKALAAGFDTTAIVRNKAKLKSQPTAVLEKEILTLTAEDLTGFDAILLAYKAPEGQEDGYAKVFQHLKEILSDNPVRLIIMGGAGSLYTDETHNKKHWETMPQDASWIATPRELAKASEIIKQSDLNWTYVSPADLLELDAPETGDVTISDNVLRYNSKGESKLSYADYTQTLINLVKTGEHQREHISLYQN